MNKQEVQHLDRNYKKKKSILELKKSVTKLKNSVETYKNKLMQKKESVIQYVGQYPVI